MKETEVPALFGVTVICQFVNDVAKWAQTATDGHSLARFEGEGWGDASSNQEAGR